MPRSPKWSLSQGFRHHNPVCTSSLPHTCYMPHPSHSSFHCPNNVWCGEHIIKLLVVQSSQMPCYLIPLRHKHIPQHPILKHSQPMYLLHCKNKFQTCRKQQAKLCMYVYWVQNVFLGRPTPRLHCFLSSHWPSFRFLSFMAFFIPSIQFFFDLPRALFCFGIHYKAKL